MTQAVRSRPPAAGDRAGAPATAVTVVVAAVTGTNLLHAAAHVGRGNAALAAWQEAFIAVVVLASPIAVAVLVRMGHRRAGSGLLLASMVGSLGFGIAYHVLVAGPDNVRTLPAGPWTIAFSATATLLVIVEAAGCVTGWRALGATTGRR